MTTQSTSTRDVAQRASGLTESVVGKIAAAVVLATLLTAGCTWTHKFLIKAARWAVKIGGRGTVAYGVYDAIRRASDSGKVTRPQMRPEGGP